MEREDQAIRSEAIPSERGGDGGHGETIATVSHDAADAHHERAGPMDPSGSMFLWTLLTFCTVSAVLAKVAWKPILAGLDKREADIRQSIENAEKVASELAGIEETRHGIISKADEDAKGIVTRARRAGVEAERVIRDKAKDEIAILRENADREITAAQEKARADLRRESVESAINLAGKLIGENLDDNKNRQLTDRLIEQM